MSLIQSHMIPLKEGISRGLLLIKMCCMHISVVNLVPNLWANNVPKTQNIVFSGTSCHTPIKG
jgi:hypothetical protein